MLFGAAPLADRVKFRKTFFSVIVATNDLGFYDLWKLDVGISHSNWHGHPTSTASHYLCWPVHLVFQEDKHCSMVHP
jgi:hypothetical protein